MASNYVGGTGDWDEGTFHGHGHHSNTTTPTGSAASPRTTRRRWPGSASAPSGASHGPAYKCVCAPATHPGSFKCRLHRTSNQGHGQGPSSPTAANAAPSSSSHTVAAQ